MLYTFVPWRLWGNLIDFDPGRSKSPALRTSKIYDACGNTLVIPSKKLPNKKVAGAERKSTSIAETASVENNNSLDMKASSNKSIMRKPTFKEFEGKLNGSSRASKLVKSQSLDHEPRSPTPVKPRPITPSSKADVKIGKDSVKKERRGLSRRAREVFLLPENQNGKDENNLQQTGEIQPKQKKFMNKFFQR